MTRLRDLLSPDPSRVRGTTFPRDRAPAGSVPLGPEAPETLRERVAWWLAAASLRVLRVGPGDVIVVRGERPDSATVAALVRAVNRGRDDDPVVIFLPRDCAVHVEGRKIDQEDRGGYRETAVTTADKKANADKSPPRGVYTGPPSDTE